MKPVQVLIDEDLLRQLDDDDEVKRLGRSAVLRRAAAEYLARSREQRISAAYRRAYAAGEGLGEEFAGWAQEGAWPEK